MNDSLRAEYNLKHVKGGVRGKYHERYKERLRFVRLSPEVTGAFPTEESVNRALRLLIDLAHQQVPPTTTPA